MVASSELVALASRARDASVVLKCASSDMKNACLERLEDALQANAATIMEANEVDLKRSREAALDKALLKRLDIFTRKNSETCRLLQGCTHPR